MKLRIKKLAWASVCAVMSIAVISGCGAKQTVTETPEPYPEGTYAFIPKDIQNNYMQKVYEGFEAACRERGMNAVYEAPEAPTPEKQSEIIKSLIERKISGIAIAANDENALEPALKEAADAGIKVISLDSAVNKNSRLLHVQQANPEYIGRHLIRTAYDIADGEGGIAILSATDQATNQNLWLYYMHREIEENQQKYASTPILMISYGNDNMMKSKTETEAILQNPDVKVIIAPTTVGMAAAGEVLTEKQSDVKLTGLGLPSQMATYIESGICPVMFLWNPYDVGYLAGQSMYALASGTITGNAGETFDAGRLSSHTITLDMDMGTEVILCALHEFNSSNIDLWKDIY